MCFIDVSIDVLVFQVFCDQNLWYFFFVRAMWNAS